MCERESSDGAGAYPITPSTQMGEYWAVEAANGHLNISDKPLVFIEPEGEHAAAAVTAGLSMTGMRATNFSSGQGIVYMHESLYGAVGKRLTYVLNMGCRAITKASLNVHAAHDDYHAVDDTGFFQLMAKNVQQAADLNIICHRIAELALTPGIIGQDGFLTTHLIESLNVPERELIAEYLGRPDDIIDTPTPAQRMLYGPKRRRIPELWSVDNPVLSGPVQNQDSYMQTTASQRPFFFDHIEELSIRAMKEFSELTGRPYGLIETYKIEDADYVYVGMGSVVPSAEEVADYLRKTRGIKVGVMNVTMYRPFPGKYITKLLKGKKGVVVMERTDQPLAEDLPLIREIRSAMNKSLENGRSKKEIPYPNYEVYSKLEDLPPLFSCSYGLGSRDLQPEGLIGAIENMLPEGKHKKLFYLSIDFIRDQAMTPKQEVYQQQLLENYPNLKDLVVQGSENPNLMPKDCITIRLHSIGGWGAMATGKSLTMTLADILGYYIKSNPKYGSEKKGQPTTYYLAVAPEPIRINCEYFFVDVVLSPDPNVFKHSNPLAGLKEGGVFVIQSDLEDQEKVWKSIPRKYQEIIIKKNYRIFYIDAFAIAKSEASDPELQYRMQGIAFQGSFFATSSVRSAAKLSEEDLFKTIEQQLEHKFGSKGRRIVDDNLRVVQRGYAATHEITNKTLGSDAVKQDVLPFMLKKMPINDTHTTDIHRFWEQIGYFYKVGEGNNILADPFSSTGLIPASTGVFKDMTNIRFEYPEWIAENCTACGNCWVACPDSAIPGLVSDLGEIFQTGIKRLEKRGVELKHLRKAVRSSEKVLRQLIDQGTDKDSVKLHMERAISNTLTSFAGEAKEKQELEVEFNELRKELEEFQFSVTRPFFGLKEKKEKGSGGLLSITVNPYTCKGCMECVKVCGDEALKAIPQTEDAVAKMQRKWDFWLDLPNTPEKFIRIDNLEEGIGALETLLLDKQMYNVMVGGDGACLGCAEKTVIHMFTAAVTALMQPRVQKQLLKIDDLIVRLEQHVKAKLTVNITNTDLLQQVVHKFDNHDMTLADLASQLDSDRQPLDTEWLSNVSGIIAGLKKLKWQYMRGITGNGRAAMGIVNATGCTSVWGSTYPINPYPFPWTNHLFQDSPSVAMGLFEGHMQRMAEGFRFVREAEKELSGKAESVDLTYFTWKNFTEEEFLLCPPVVAVGGDGAMYDIGFQNLSRMMMSGMPIKVVVLDTQVYSNTGGQACTSGFTGQISDMAHYGKVSKGKEEIRKEMSFIGIAHRTSYVLQSSLASTSHLLEGFIEGLMSHRPALFNIYTSCQPEHGIGDDMATHQAKLALESRAYPMIRYNPDKGTTPSECLNLDGNPDMDKNWPTYTLKYTNENGEQATMDVEMTFADFAATEARFRKHYREAPRDTWNDDKMIPIAQFIELDQDAREGKFPFIWATNKKGHLSRVIVADPIVKSTEDRLSYWRAIKNIAGVDVKQVSEDDIANDVRTKMIAQLAQKLVQLSNIDSN
ncbi:MAG: 2-oxoacid:acceptor oxidoreductase family protein [SAR324 cluster bacterium]|nr:2-oxoacid:acceptor oxidoreductase family protein [SAR324 cluster bacterium]